MTKIDDGMIARVVNAMRSPFYGFASPTRQDSPNTTPYCTQDDIDRAKARDVLNAALNAPQPPVRGAMQFGGISLGINGAHISNAYIIDTHGTRHDFGVGSVKDFDAFVAKVLAKPHIEVNSDMIKAAHADLIKYTHYDYDVDEGMKERWAIIYRAMRALEPKQPLQKWNECRHEFGVCGATSITCHLCGEAFHANVVSPNEKKFKVSWFTGAAYPTCPSGHQHYRSTDNVRPFNPGVSHRRKDDPR